MLDPGGDDGLLDALPSSEPNAERAFDRAWAVTLANEAHIIAQTDADDRGRPDDYVVFRMHVMDRMEYDAIAAALGITPSQAKHAAARVGERMRGDVRELLRAEGVRAEELDAEVGKLMRLIEESAGCARGAGVYCRGRRGGLGGIRGRRRATNCRRGC